MIVRRVFVDTNVLVRATVSAAPSHTEARLLLDALWDEQAELYISHQVVREYIANTTRPQTYSPAIGPSDVLMQVSAFRESFFIVPDSAEVLDKLLAVVREVSVGGKQIHDANIVATMLAFGITELLTYNPGDFRRFSDFVRVSSAAAV